jgi:hypothetical protein
MTRVETCRKKRHDTVGSTAVLQQEAALQLPLLLRKHMLRLCNYLYCRPATRSRTAVACTAVLCHEFVLQLALPVFLWCESQETIDSSYAVTRFHNKLTLILCYDKQSGRDGRNERTWKMHILRPSYFVTVRSGGRTLAFQRNINGTDGGHVFLRKASSHLPNFTVA